MNVLLKKDYIVSKLKSLITQKSQLNLRTSLRYNSLGTFRMVLN